MKAMIRIWACILGTPIGLVSLDGELQRTIGMLRDEWIELVKRNIQPSPTRDDSPAPMKDPQLNSMLYCYLLNCLSRAIDLPVRRQESPVLIAIGVAEHHLKCISPRAEVVSVDTSNLE